MRPSVLNYEIRNKQTTIEHNFIEYPYSYMFRHRGVIVRLTFRTYYKQCTYCIVGVTSCFLQMYAIYAICILILIFSKRQPVDGPIV
jgi:hypothetical protein